MTLRALVPHAFGCRATPARMPWPQSRDWNELFDGFRRNAAVAPAAGAAGSFNPRIDVSETEEELRLTAELPGLGEKDFDVSVEGDVVTLKGEKRVEREEKQEGYHRVERSGGTFQRAFELPFAVDPERVKAEYKNGVLTVAVGKPDEAKHKVRSIPVTTG